MKSRRNTESRRGWLLMLCPIQLYVPPGPSVFGSGSRLSSFCPLESIRLAGMTLPGNGAPLFGSFTTINAPFCSKDREKCPPRSSGVGKVYVERFEGIVRGRKSCDQKKNNLSRFLLKSVPGISTGPPRKYPGLLNR